jgi:hypothetical protein
MTEVLQNVIKSKSANMMPGTSSRAMSKIAMLEALRVHRGLVTYAAKAAKIARCLHYKWLKNDPEYADAVANLKNFVLDEVEDVAHKMIVEDRNPAMTIFFLKCQGKERGYVERTEVEHSISNKLKETVELAISAYEKDY